MREIIYIQYISMRHLHHPIIPTLSCVRLEGQKFWSLRGCLVHAFKNWKYVWIYVWMKKKNEIHIMLFKNWKHVFKSVYQMEPNFCIRICPLISKTVKHTSFSESLKAKSKFYIICDVATSHASSTHIKSLINNYHDLTWAVWCWPE